MILFKKQWEQYPNAIADTKTKNTSFVRYSTLLREMGVENYLWPLQLHNPELQGLDPHDENLTVHQKIDIAEECRCNFVYFMREVARTSESTVDFPIGLLANRGNMSALWLFFNSVYSISVQPRQTGKSTWFATLVCWLLNIGTFKANIMLLTKDDDLRAKTLAAFKSMIDSLPPYLNMLTLGGVANTEEIIIKNRDNHLVAFLPNKSPKLAERVGRGHTSEIVMGDEAAYFSNIRISLPAALAATIARYKLAERMNKPRCISLFTTAGSKDDVDGKYVYELLQKATVWTEKFMDAEDQKTLYEIIKSNNSSGESKVNCTFNYKQLGYTRAWMVEALERTGLVGESANKDMFNIWESGTSSSPFKPDIAKMIADSIVTNYTTEFYRPYNYAMRWYIPDGTSIDRFMETDDFVLSVDSSEAIGKDEVFVVIRSISTGALVAAGNYNETFVIKLASFICDLVVKYKRLTAIIERRSTGITIIEHMLMVLPQKGIDPFKRIYNTIVQNASTNKDLFDEISRTYHDKNRDNAEKYKKYFGFATSGSGETSRNDLYGVTLNSAARLTGGSVKDSVLISQILGLVIRNGRLDHKAGGRDDGVMAWLLSIWLMLNGKNLSHYGIAPGSVLLHNEVRLNDMNREVEDERVNQTELKTTINEIVDTVRVERDENVRYILKHRLKRLYGMLSGANKSAISIDELMSNLDMNKKNNRYR